MTNSDVPQGEMPNIPWPGRRDAPEIEDAALTALLAGELAAADQPVGLRALAEALAALAAEPTSDEFAGEAAALAEFRSALATPAPADQPAAGGLNVPGAKAAAGAGAPAGRPRHARSRSRGRRLLSLAPGLSGKLAAAATAATVGLAGIATAAYAGVLPGPLQSLAHAAIGAPPAGSSPANGPSANPGPGGSPGASARPDGSASARALCAAYHRAQADGTPSERAAAFRALTAAAGGAAKVPAYCAVSPGAPPSPGAGPPVPTASQSAQRTLGKPPKPHAHPSPHPHPSASHP